MGHCGKVFNCLSGRGKLLVIDFFFLLQGFDRTMRLQVKKYWEYYCKNNLKVANWKVKCESELK